MKINEKSLKKCVFGIMLFAIFGITVIAGCGKKEEDYRQIQVYKIDGSATVARAGSSMDVYENMQLQSGDVVETVANSYLQLKLDEDKYILLEPDTKISLQATGNSADTNTAIFLEKGAIVNQLDNPLSEKSNYQVTTPNSTMAVRGTTFRVEITYDENGESFAKVAVYSGKVECQLVFPDGTIQEPVMIEAGTEVLVRGDSEESEYVRTGKASYNELKEKVLDFLDVIISRGKELSISKEEIEVLIELQKALEEGEAELEVVPEEEEEILDEELEEETKPEAIEEPKEEPKEELEQPIPTPDNSSVESETSSNEDSSYGGGSSSGGSSSGGGSNGGGSTEGGSSGDTAGGENTEKTENVTVYFMANNTTFAYKEWPGTVKDNIITVTIDKIPYLRPSSLGSWVYNGGKVTDGVTITAALETPIQVTWTEEKLPD